MSPAEKTMQLRILEALGSVSGRALSSSADRARERGGLVGDVSTGALGALGLPRQVIVSPNRTLVTFLSAYQSVISKDGSVVSIKLVDPQAWSVATHPCLPCIFLEDSRHTEWLHTPKSTSPPMSMHVTP